MAQMKLLPLVTGLHHFPRSQQITGVNIDIDRGDRPTPYLEDHPS